MSSLLSTINASANSLTAPLREHIEVVVEHDTGVFNNHFRLLSEQFFEFIKQSRQLRDAGVVQFSEHDNQVLDSDLGEWAEFEGEQVPLDCPLTQDFVLNEKKAEYDGRKVKLRSPMRSKGPKKFKVYVRNKETGEVNKVNFGAEDGGGDLAVKLDDPEARKNFAARHKCDKRDDPLTASYWSCRLPRYAKQLGLSGGGSHWW